jgi:DNA recombination-dependent growth factor C
MDGTRKYHSELGNSVTKGHLRYALTDKWILAKKFGIPKIQFTDHMKPKKKKEQSVDASVLLRT